MKPGMSSRERVQAALAFQPVDLIPLQIHPSPGGLYEHGAKLLELMKTCGHDFGSLDDFTLPIIPPEDFDTDGRYHVVRTDEWGTTWEFRQYGIWGYRIGYPLADISLLPQYRPPSIEKLSGETLDTIHIAGEAHRQQYYQVGGGISLFETLQSLRPFEDVLIDITHDTPEINQLADLLVDYFAVTVQNALLAQVDAISVGDDFGTQQALMMSPKTWQRFFLPRYQRLFAPIKQAGKRIFFHSCGQVSAIVPDLRSIGVDAIWPQLPLYPHVEFARQCRELGLALTLHPDRGNLMQRSTPAQVREYLLRLVDEFDCLSGGSWLYAEIDPGFPWENVEMMFKTIMELRGC